MPQASTPPQTEPATDSATVKAQEAAPIAAQAGTAPITSAPKPQQVIPADARPVSEVMKADSIKKATEAAKQIPLNPQQTFTPVQPPKPQAAMPKDDDWDLPENFSSKNAFVPIEADAE